jgi:hypothetical protein
MNPVFPSHTIEITPADYMALFFLTGDATFAKLANDLSDRIAADLAHYRTVCPV